MATAYPPTRTAAIELKGLNKSFGTEDIRTQVLFDINTSIYPGEMTLLVGPSGCGKTTLISIIAGIMDYDSGEVSVFGEHWERASDRKKTDLRRQWLGFIFQQYNLVPTLTAQENVAIPLLIAKEPYEKAMKKAAETLEQVDMKNRLNYYPSQLSGGQQQRVAIARALVRDPKLIVCDEPTAALDGATGQTVMRFLKQIAIQPDRAVIVVTHDNRIFEFGDRILEMEDGRIQRAYPNHSNNEAPSP